MRSPTQRVLSPADLDAMVATSLGSAVVAADELSGGGFAAVWQATLADGRDVVVKVGPPPEARLLRYERALISTEAHYFTMVREHAPGVPVPAVVAVSSDPEWIVTTLLPGRSLTEADSPRARTDLGAALARVHRITGPHFGYTGDRPSANTWPTSRSSSEVTHAAAARADASAVGVQERPGR